MRGHGRRTVVLGHEWGWRCASMGGEQWLGSPANRGGVVLDHEHGGSPKCMGGDPRGADPGICRLLLMLHAPLQITVAWVCRIPLANLRACGLKM
jgi:hypothetical protein